MSVILETLEKIEGRSQLEIISELTEDVNNSIPLKRLENEYRDERQ